jgi:hypothetical protein
MMESNMSNATGVGVTTVEVYTGILVMVLVLTAGVIGTGVNAALLVAGLCWNGGSSASGSTRLHYGLHYALAATHLLLCCVWLPLHAVQSLANVRGAGNPRALCLSSLALWNVCVAMLTFLTLFLAVQRLYKLSLLPARTPVTRGLAVSLAVALTAAVALCIEYPWNADHRLCETARAEHGGPLWFSVAAMLFMLIYVLILLLAIFLLGLAIAAVRRKLAPPNSAPDKDEEARSSETRSLSGTGATAGGEQPSASSSHHESSRASPPPPQPVDTHDDDDEDDDDTFDMKMRMRAQKTSSGRRHTVANIGLGDSLFGFGKRRGSLEDNRPKVNYNYVRKWSVDITALQNQLENPKVATSLPFGELAALKDNKTLTTPSVKAEQSESIAEHEEEEDNDHDEKKVDKVDDELEVSEVHQAKVSFADETDNDEVIAAEESDPLATSTIVVNGSSPHLRDTGATGLDEESADRYRRELWRSKQCVVVVAVTLTFLLPYTLLTLLAPAMDPHLNRNLAAVAMALLAGLSCVHPPLLLWMDARLAASCRRLYAHATQWRCVCYCNIGKGKKCFGRPPELEGGGGGGSVTVIA